jgi:hypothetical protein
MLEEIIHVLMLNESAIQNPTKFHGPHCLREGSTVISTRVSKDNPFYQEIAVSQRIRLDRRLKTATNIFGHVSDLICSFPSEWTIDASTPPTSQQFGQDLYTRLKIVVRQHQLSGGQARLIVGLELSQERRHLAFENYRPGSDEIRVFLDDC